LANGGGVGIQELNLSLAGEVERIQGGVARLRFVVKDAKSRVRRMTQNVDVKFNYVQGWPGKTFVVDLDRATGAPLEVVENTLPDRALDPSQRGTLFAELARDRSLLRILEGTFHYFPRSEIPAGGSWVLSEEPLEALLHIVRVQIPAAALHIGGTGFKVRFGGSDRQITLKDSERTVRVDPEGRYRYGVPGDHPLPKPSPPGRDIRGLATVERGWIKESLTQEAFWLEYPEKPGGVPQIKVEMHVKRGLRLTLSEDAGPTGE